MRGDWVTDANTSLKTAIVRRTARLSAVGCVLFLLGFVALSWPGALTGTLLPPGPARMFFVLMALLYFYAWFGLAWDRVALQLQPEAHISRETLNQTVYATNLRFGIMLVPVLLLWLVAATLALPPVAGLNRVDQVLSFGLVGGIIGTFAFLILYFLVTLVVYEIAARRFRDRIRDEPADDQENETG